jgi:lipopolysaccharide transport system ATP-binding protein
VRRFCSKALLLRHGEQVAFGDTNEIIDKYVYGVDAEDSTENMESEQESGELINLNDDVVVEKGRWGDKKVVITGVKFIDKFGRESTMFNSGDSMTIRIEYDVNEAMCYGTNTDIRGYVVDNASGSNEINLIIHNLTMMEGKFHLTVAAHSKEHEPYDWRDKQFSFNVVKNGNDAGFFDIPCEWKQ